MGTCQDKEQSWESLIPEGNHWFGLRYMLYRRLFQSLCRMENLIAEADKTTLTTQLRWP
jgi:hypothetical protein